jgi:hypothetical protein
MSWRGLLGRPAFAATAHVVQTGQTVSYAAGDDGEIQAGVTPPTPRFKNNGDGTVTDKLTGLMWLKQDDCLGPVSWAQALMAASTLVSGRCGLSDRSKAGDWRLPNVRELLSLVDFGFSSPALSNTDGTAQWSEGDVFSGSPSRGYWTSTTRDASPGSAWLVEMGEGYAMPQLTKDFLVWVWPVRGGK